MVDRIYKSLQNNVHLTDIQQIIPIIGFKIVGTEMNYLDTERRMYQDQDRYATRIKKPELFVQTLGALHNQMIKTLHPRQSHREII